MIRAFQWDLARQVERLDWLLAQLPKYSDWGYQELHLHLEDAVDYPSLPGVARRDAYSWRQFERLVRAATKHGIKVVPIVNLLGHTQYLIKTEEWRDLNELRADDGSPLNHGQICPSHPRTLEVAEKLIRDVAPFCTAGRVHVGLDESFLLGRHPASRADVASLGLAGYFARYVGQLKHVADAQDLKLAIWADMLALLPDAIEHLPSGIAAYDWYYYAFPKHPRFEARNFADYDLVPALKARDIDYWGCPMNGAFRHEPLPVFGDRLANAISWWRRCRETQAVGFLVTGWEPNRLAPETSMLVDAAIAGLWLDSDSPDHVSLLRNGIKRLYGPKRAPELARTLLACDERAFSGYVRWETHQRWDTQHDPSRLSRVTAEARFFSRSAQSPLPPVLKSSLQWRHYLARRDCLIHQHTNWIQHGRRLLVREREALITKMAKRAVSDIDGFLQSNEVAEEAVNAMWLSSRRKQQPNPNREILRADRQRARSLRQWWKSVAFRTDNVVSASRVMGRWQVQARVHTTRPNLQAIVIQTQNAAGKWEDQHLRYLIEFRNLAAKPRSRRAHTISLPLDEPTTPVRFGLRGMGTFELSDITLTNGVQHVHAQLDPARGGRRIRLGLKTETADVLSVDRSKNRDDWQPEWIGLKL